MPQTISPKEKKIVRGQRTKFWGIKWAPHFIKFY